MFRILKPHERAIVLRLACIVNVVGPGPVWYIPVVDHLAVVDLERALPGWQSLEEHELRLVACHISEMYTEDKQVNLDLATMRKNTRSAPRAPKNLRTFPYD
jgi:regulator of protease activity HflC (stomatin/prohibitin superfamily)